MTVEYQKWLTKLLGFDFEIEYKSGLENKAANALSRIELATSLTILSMPCVLQQDEWLKAVEGDPELSQNLAALRKDPTSYPNFALVWGALLYRDKLVLPKDSSFVLLALQEGHDSKLGGMGASLKHTGGWPTHSIRGV